MNKNQLRTIRLFLAVCLFSTVQLPLSAQVSNPASWSSFVKEETNVLSVDTFKRQSFTGKPTDNWEYTASEGVSLRGKKTMHIPAGGTLSLAPFDAASYMNPTIHFRVGGTKLETGEIFRIEYLFNGELQTQDLLIPHADEDGSPFSFREIHLLATSLNISVGTPPDDKLDGVYYVDSLKAYGTVPRYILYQNSGTWEDKANWSNPPLKPEQSVLLNGDLTIDSNQQCRQLLIGEGTLNVTGSLTVDTLILISQKDITPAFHHTGNLTVRKQVELRYTFPEKGTWYFLSFPFDVTISGIDERFTLQDDTFEGSGNYLYAQVYDGEQRAESNSTTGNWRVLSPALTSSSIAFKQGKGYLIALDAAADYHTLTFTVDASELPDDFGKATTIPVTEVSTIGNDDANNGWYLCGNPLPAPLTLSQIIPNNLLDGNIYIYNGTDYTAYPIGSNYQLPPFAAFFVKASRATSLQLLDTPPTKSAIPIPANNALRSLPLEPMQTATGNTPQPATAWNISVVENTLHIESLPTVATLRVCNLMGQQVYRQTLPAGSSSHPLPFVSGCYLLSVETADDCQTVKCFITW